MLNTSSLSANNKSQGSIFPICQNMYCCHHLSAKDNWHGSHYAPLPKPDKSDAKSFVIFDIFCCPTRELNL